MSRFTDLITDLITARHNGVCHPQMPGLIGFEVETSVRPYLDFDKEYLVSLNFNRIMRVCSSVPERIAAAEARKSFQKELQYLVYSDLAPLIHNLREHVYRSGNRELGEAFKALQDEVMGR